MGMFTLAIFVNFTVLPGLAAMFDWDISTLNNNISEEEVKNNIANFNEKYPPKPYKSSDYIQQRYSFRNKNVSFIQKDDSMHLNPLLTIFSPPPEV